MLSAVSSSCGKVLYCAYYKCFLLTADRSLLQGIKHGINIVKHSPTPMLPPTKTDLQCPPQSPRINLANAFVWRENRGRGLAFPLNRRFHPLLRRKMLANRVPTRIDYCPTSFVGCPISNLNLCPPIKHLSRWGTRLRVALWFPTWPQLHAPCLDTPREIAAIG